MGTELPIKVMLGQTLVLMQMIFLNNLRKVDRLVLSRTSCFIYVEGVCYAVHFTVTVNSTSEDRYSDGHSDIL
jgi:hypothetical protein